MPAVQVTKLSLVTNAYGDAAAPKSVLALRREWQEKHRAHRKQRRQAAAAAAASAPGSEAQGPANAEHALSVSGAVLPAHSDQSGDEVFMH